MLLFVSILLLLLCSTSLTSHEFRHIDTRNDTSYLLENVENVTLSLQIQNFTCDDIVCTHCPTYISDSCLRCKSKTSVFVLTETHLFGVCQDYTFEDDKVFEPESISTLGDEISSTGFLFPPGHKPRSLLPVQWTDCFPENILHARIGLAFTDEMYANILGSDYAYAKLWSYALVETMNVIYTNQVALTLELGEIYVPTLLPALEAICPVGWNASCTPEDDFLNCTAVKKLYPMTPWLRCLRDNAFELGYNNEEIASWQLIDYQPAWGGNAGLAYVDASCDQRGFNTGYNVYGSSGTLWRVVAHELGHNFGALHPLDAQGNVATENAGIMGYGDSRIDGEYQFDEENRPRVCTHLTVVSCQGITSSSVNRTFFVEAFGGDYGPSDTNLTLPPTEVPVTSQPTTSLNPTQSPTLAPSTPAPTTVGLAPASITVLLSSRGFDFTLLLVFLGIFVPLWCLINDTTSEYEPVGSV